MLRRYLAALAALAALWPASALAQTATPVMASHGVPNTGSQRYAPVVAGSDAISIGDLQTGQFWRTPLPIAVTVDHLRVRCPTTVTAGTWDVYVQKNGADTTQTVQCNSTTNPNGGSDNAHPISFAAGDDIEIRINPTGTPTAQSSGFMTSVLMTGATANRAPIFFVHLASTTQNLFMAPGGIVPNTSTSDQGSGVVSPPGTVYSIYGMLSAAPGAGATVTYTVYKNGAASTCSLTFGAADTALGSPSNCATPIAYAAGDTITIARTFTGAPASATGSISLEFRPTTDGESPQFATLPAASSTAAARFADAAGTGLSNSSEVSPVNVAPSALTAKNLYAGVVTAPGGAAQWAFTYRLNAATDTSLSALISASGLTGSDTTPGDAVSVSDTNLVDLHITPTGTPAAAGSMRFGWTSYISPPASPAANSTLLSLGVGQ